MALSQLQCLDEGNINFRTNESKPEFFYSEGQRLAVEALVAEGLHAFNETVTKENLREFLSELDVQQILRSVRDFLTEEVPGGWRAEDGEEPGPEPGHIPLSLHYWPDPSDVSRPSLDLGWPDCAAYRGVTRANVYTQPPLEGSVHIKEMFRRMIGQAQKVIAVVMDIFTDIDIFKDLLDASFKRKVPVYIIHDEANIKYFMKMCQNAGMHVGMLKNLRVFTVDGNEFTTRSAKTIVGRQMQKFLLVDGDRAASGSYSFTWTASRLDRNIITVLSGQAVETFDKQFRELLHFSKPVNLRQLNLAPEEEPPEPVQQAVTLTAEQTAAIAKKLINPKYALVRANIAGSLSSEKKVNSNGTGKKQSDVPAKGQKTAEAIDEEQRVHPALANMPKVNMFLYLPTYVEIPEEKHQQQNVNEVKHEPHQCNSSKMHKAKGDPSKQKKAACKNPSLTQAETSTVQQDPVQNHPLAEGDTRDAENGLELCLTSANGIEAPKVREKREADVGQEDVQPIEAPSGNATHHKEEEENQTIDIEDEQVDSDASADRPDGEKQVDGILDSPDREESDEEVLPTCNADEGEDVTESNEADPDQNTLPVEDDLICLEDDCPSTPSTNYTPDWTTDSSSLPEQSIASSGSDDFYDCANASVKKLMPDPMIKQANNEVTVRKENNFIRQGNVGRPLNNFRELSHLKDSKEPKTVEAFFNDQATLRKRALDKLKLTLEIRYHDKFQQKFLQQD
ncbi:protein FAM83G-like isoform X2 [Pristis pectinata]|uniref:protein FAM83G-like isoform X2 n=1 Tax=Pristis pectinata TaxID=685728 RepID=UPI00223E8E96|nr:protein FAM83G-like isoform X2 [Pristis pectinata]